MYSTFEVKCKQTVAACCLIAQRKEKFTSLTVLKGCERCKQGHLVPNTLETIIEFVLHIHCREKYMRFGLEGGKSVILDRVQATTDGPIILKQHAITFDRSADLQRATNNNVTAEQPGTLPTDFGFRWAIVRSSCSVQRVYCCRYPCASAATGQCCVASMFK